MKTTTKKTAPSAKTIPSKTRNGVHIELDCVLNGAPRRFSYALIKLINAAGLDLDKKTSVLLTRRRGRDVITGVIQSTHELLRQFADPAFQKQVDAEKKGGAE